VPLGEGSQRSVLRVAGVCLVLVLACASTPWPDEPGLPVAVGLAANVDAGDSFLTALTAARRAQSLPPPLVTPRYQSEIRSFAQDLQAGRTSAAGAKRAIESWGRVAYQRPVASWLLDCSGPSPLIPTALAELPSAVVSYAAAHFRPRSLPRDQCAILVVALTGGGGETVRSETIK
jgi:hypothetical protein